MKRVFVILVLFIGACKGVHHGNNSERIEKMLQEGFQSDARQDDSASFRIYDSILQLAPDNYIALVNRGRAKIELGDTIGGFADLTLSIKIHPTAEAFVSKAIAEMNRDPGQAFKDLRAGDLAVPGQGKLISMLSAYYTSIHPLRDSALYYANDACSLSNTPPAFYLELMDTYLVFDDYPNLLKVADTVIVHFPKRPYPYNNRGLAKLNLGDLSGAMKDIRISLNLDSNNAWAWRNMGLVFAKLNNLDSSCFYLKTGRQKDKQHQYKKDLDSLILKFCGRR